MLPTTVVCNEGIPGAVLTFTHFLNSSKNTTISTHIQRLHSAQNTALFWMFRKFTKYTSQTLSNKVLTVFLYLLFCIFRFGVKNRTVNEKQTRTKSFTFLVQTKWNQENQTTSINTPEIWSNVISDFVKTNRATELHENVSLE